MNRKISTSILALILAILLIGCGKTGSTSAQSTRPNSTYNESSEDAPQETPLTPADPTQTATSNQSSLAIPCVPLSCGTTTGYKTTIASIASNGTLYTWGSNKYGCIGCGESDLGKDYDTPQKIMDDVVAVSIGGTHAAAIKTDGTLWMWGNNNYGQLGIEDTYVRTSPTKVLDDVKAVSCGRDFTAAIKSDNTLWIWGNNRYGQLGNGDSGKDENNNDKCSFAPIMVMEEVTAISCGTNDIGILKKDGTLWMWGETDRGQILGYSLDAPDLSIPTKMMDDVIAVSCGFPLTAIIKKDGTLWMWGCGSAVARQLMDDVSIISAGSDVIGAIKKDGSLWMWGAGNRYGVLGDGSSEEEIYSTDYYALDPVQILDKINCVACGNGNAAAIKEDGTLWMWGNNSNGQLGTGSHSEEDYSSTPIQVKSNMMVLSKKE